MSSNASPGQILYAQANGDVVVVRVVGRGNSDLSSSLKRLAETFSASRKSPRFVLDMGECPTLDSTFMGVMAAMGLHQMTCLKEKVVVVNVGPTTETQLTKLGLKHLLDIRGRSERTDSLSDQHFRVCEEGGQTRLEKIVHMIESHQALIDANSGNEIPFRPVLSSLGDSLDREIRHLRKV